VSAQLAAESDAIANAIAAVENKLRDADSLRGRRLAAAIRILHAGVPLDSSQERTVAARRRAAAKLLLKRDASECRLLADELSHLRSDANRVAAAGTQAAAIDVSAHFLWPSRGMIGRKFGDFIHERSKATLSRRGIDIMVEPRANVVAPTAGVVRYAGAIRGLDRGVILDHGSYFAIVAKLDDVVPAVGTTVAEGDTLGRAADHRVYLEVRIKVGAGGLPIDPLPLLKRPL